MQKQVKVPSCASHVPPKRHGEESQSSGAATEGTVGGCVNAATVAVAPIAGLNGEDGESGGRCFKDSDQDYTSTVTNKSKEATLYNCAVC